MIYAHKSANQNYAVHNSHNKISNQFTNRGKRKNDNILTFDKHFRQQRDNEN